MLISVIIPTFNEEMHIGKLVRFLNATAAHNEIEIIVTDGGSTDNTVLLAEESGAKVCTSPLKGRAGQMHFATTIAKGDVFYFIHADSLPPTTFVADICSAIGNGYTIGRYKTAFRSHNLLLKINQWFTRFDWLICMGGDQSLFVEKNLYYLAGGFDTSLVIMEEYYFGLKARVLGKYIILNGTVSVSARKYINNSWLSVQYANYKAFSMFKQGKPNAEINALYRRLLK